jgi:hypothetical protein
MTNTTRENNNRNLILGGLLVAALLIGAYMYSGTDSSTSVERRADAGMGTDAGAANSVAPAAGGMTGGTSTTYEAAPATTTQQ